MADVNYDGGSKTTPSPKPQGPNVFTFKDANDLITWLNERQIKLTAEQLAVINANPYTNNERDKIPEDLKTSGDVGGIAFETIISTNGGNQYVIKSTFAGVTTVSPIMTHAYGDNRYSGAWDDISDWATRDWSNDNGKRVRIQFGGTNEFLCGIMARNGTNYGVMGSENFIYAGSKTGFIIGHWSSRDNLNVTKYRLESGSNTMSIFSTSLVIKFEIWNPIKTGSAD